MFSVVHHHFICLHCRRSAKEARFYELTSETRLRGWRLRPMKCSHCGGKMPCVGKNFTPPRRHDEKQWKKLEWMIAQGWPGPNWQAKPSMSLRDVRETAPPRPDTARMRLLLWERHRAAQKKLQQKQRHKVHKARKKKQRAAKDWQRQTEYQDRVINSQHD